MPARDQVRIILKSGVFNHGHVYQTGILVVFFGVMVFIGLYCRKHTTDVNGFVLGGRSVGPWLTAFAYGTSYFSAVVFVGYAGQFGWKYGIAATWAGIATHCWARCWPGSCWAAGPGL